MLDVLWRELLLNLFTGLVGLALSYFLVPSWTTWSRALLAYPVGSCVLVWLCIPTIAAGIGIVPLLTLASCGLACLAAMRWCVQDWRDFVRGFTLAGVVIAAVTSLAVWLNSPILTIDSYELVFLGWSFHSPDALSLAWGQLNIIPVFVAVLQGIAYAVGLEYLVSLSPLFAFSTFGIMASVLSRHEGVGGARAAAIAILAAAFLASSYACLQHAVYVNAHAVTACFVTLSLLLIWTSRANDDFGSWRLLALTLPTISIARMEGTLVAVLLGVLVAATDAWPRRTRAAVLAICLLASASWYVPLAIHVWGFPLGGNVAADGPWKYGALMLVLSGPLVVGSIDLFKPLRRELPSLVALVLLSALVAGMLYDPPGAARSMSSLLSNLFLFAHWGACWFGLVGGLVVASFCPRFRSQGDFHFFLGAFVVVVLAPSILRGEPYRPGWGDSANRMMFHIVPLIACYLGLVFLELYRGSGRRAAG